MAVPIIQLGQCGNQIGCNLFEQLFKQGQKSTLGHQGMLSQFFTTSSNSSNTISKPKAIQIDMQPKVVNRNLAPSISRPWAYDPKLSFVQQEGSGNNWAYGCNVHGPRVKDDIEKLLKTFVEKEDYINAFFQIQSLAGGTGSGMGTFMVQLLSQLFQKVPKFVICVMPHLSGQVILQCYNASLSIGTVYNNTDGIFVIENDQISSICTNTLKIQNTTLNDINQVIGRNLASIFFPIIPNTSSSSKIFSIQQNQLNYGIDFSQRIFSDPAYRLASISTTPHGPKQSQSFNSDSWQSIFNDLLYKKKSKSKGSLLLARGPDHPLTSNNLLKEQYQQIETLFDKHTFYNYNRSCSLIDNGPKFVNAFEMILDRGYRMFKQNAYLYQYQKYGIEKDHFMECFGVIEGMQQNYMQLINKK